MPRIGWRVALKGFAGFLVGVAVWAMLSPVYDRLVGKGAESLIRAFEKPKVTHLRQAPDGFTTVDRSDFDPRSKRPGISIRDLTFNVVLLFALFALSARVFSDRNIGGFLIALVILSLTHILGAVAEVMSIYVAKLGMWSTVNYSDFERNVWGVANHFYRLVLMYAVAFALWWIFRDPNTAAAPGKASTGASASAKKKKRR